MADEIIKQTAIPTGEQSSASEQEVLPGNTGSETGAEQTSQEQHTDTKAATTAPILEGDKKRSPWYQHRINELTRERKEKEEAYNQAIAEREELRQQLESLQRGEQYEAATPQPTQNDFDRRVNERVETMRRQQTFDEQCNRIFEAGNKEFSDFGDSLKQLGMVGDVSPQFLEAITSLEGGHKVLHHLGQNPDIAAEILTLPPVQQAIKLVEINGNLGRPKQKPVSQAPKPITPLEGGTGKGEVDLSKASLDDFMERRNREAPVRR